MTFWEIKENCDVMENTSHAFKLNKREQQLKRSKNREAV